MGGKWFGQYEKGGLPLPLMPGQDWTTLDLKDMRFAAEMEKFDYWFPRMKACYDGLAEKYKDDIDKIRKAMPKANLVVGSLPERAKELLGTEADSIFFSPDSLAKQLYNHPDMKKEEYRRVIEKINDYTKIARAKDLHVALLIEDRYLYRLVVKTTESHTEAYLVSLHKLNKDSMKTALRPKTN